MLLVKSDAQVEMGEGGGDVRPALLFFENRKKCPDIEKKALIAKLKIY